MDLENRKEIVSTSLREIISEAETLIERCRNALTAIDAVCDEATAEIFDDEIGNHVEDGLTHIELC